MRLVVTILAAFVHIKLGAFRSCFSVFQDLVYAYTRVQRVQDVAYTKTIFCLASHMPILQLSEIHAFQDR